MTHRWLFPEIVSAPFVAALLVLVINDHLLKGGGIVPGWLTGKLSDFAGLFFFPLLLAALPRAHALIDGRPRPLRRRALGLAIVATGVAFATSNLFESGAHGYRVAVGSLLGMPVASVADPTDLVALLVLPLAWAHGIRFCADGKRNEANR